MAIVSDETYKLLALSQLAYVRHNKVLVGIAEVDSFKTDTLDFIYSCLPERMRQTPLEEAREKADEQVRLAEENEMRIIGVSDPEYPSSMRNSRYNPGLLYVKGDLKEGQRATILGTREPTEHGRIMTERLTSVLVERKVSIVSNLTGGISALALRTAIQAGGSPVAVLAHGIRGFQDSDEQALADEILAGGGVLVSRFPISMTGAPYCFAERDKMQSGLSMLTVLIQDGFRGCCLQACGSAIRDYNRSLAVAMPTRRDIEVGEPMVRAAAILAADEIPMHKKSRLLDLKPIDMDCLSKLLVIRGKQDYEALFDCLAGKRDNPYCRIW